MLSLCSCSVALQGISVSWRDTLHVSGVLAFMSGVLVFAAAAQGTPTDHLALVARGVCILDPMTLWQ